MANVQGFSPASAPLQFHNNGSGSSKKPILGGILIAIVLVFVAGWLYICFSRKLYTNFKLYRKQQKGLLSSLLPLSENAYFNFFTDQQWHKFIETIEPGKLETKEVRLRRFRLEELEKATDNFSQNCLIGSGSFANVYRGTFPVEGTLAIKKPHSETYTSIEEFRNEVRLLSKVKHDNLVALVGFCEETGPKAAKILVYEYVTNGSLLNYIIGWEGRSLTWRERVKIAIGVAKGIGHLHQGISPGIIHRDLKPSNILVGAGFEAKVSDFGLVRTGPVGDQSHVISQVKGTLGYLDPAYCSSSHLTPFSDVYSFGVILLQLVTARPALDSSRTSDSASHIIDWARVSIEQGKIGEILDTNLLMQDCNMEMMQKMGEIGLRCVVKVPKERPTMSQLRQELEAALEAVDEDDSSPEQSPPQGNVWSSGNGRSHRSHSIVSVDGIGLERFHIDIDSVSFQSVSLRCLETSMTMD